MQAAKPKILSKDEREEYFLKLFQNEFNTVCYECGRKSKQWVDKAHAIYLCLNCAALYKQASQNCQIKSINVDEWTQDELKFLKNGGNRKFRQFLSNYDMQNMIYKERLRTKAAEYYRIMLKQEAAGRAAPMAPDPVSGKQLIKENASITEMSPEQLLSQAKQKAFWVGSKTKELGSKAFNSIHEKITSGDLKEDMKNAASTIGNTAKSAWETVSTKMSSLF